MSLRETMTDHGHNVRGMEMAQLSVYPLWRTGVNDAVKAFHAEGGSSAVPRYGVAMVLPEASLNLNELSDLEAAGLLVVEVPDHLRDAATRMLNQYLEEKLTELEAATRVAAAPLHASAMQLLDEDYWPTEESAGEGDDAELLESLNDPESQQDRF